MTRYGPTGHPIDPSECKNGLGDSCTPIDCVLDHKRRFARVKRDPQLKLWTGYCSYCTALITNKNWRTVFDESFWHIVECKR